MMDENNYTKEEKAYEEGAKLSYDLFKHLTTLSTGTILILVTFLEKLFQNPTWKFLVAVSFTSLIFSILASLLTMHSLAATVALVGDIEERGAKVASIVLSISLGSFLIGVVTLVLFVLLNFLK